MILYRDNSLEGFSVPARPIDADLKDYLKIGVGGALGITSEAKKKLDSHTSLMQKKYNPKNNFQAIVAKSNVKECKDTDKYGSCSIPSPSIPKIDMRYVNIPTNQLDKSDIYNKLSICPKTYQSNMEILNNKRSIGQYSGYTSNEYIDKIRYINNPSIPLPVNPDFFIKGSY
tara:strand:- start:28 stop:543 length:516 start_codon:yes stop_codon:yes gene_type:complete